MQRNTRQIVYIATVLAAAAIGLGVVQAAAASPGSVGLARGILQTQFGFSPSRAVAWTTGVCSYADKPSSCYLTPAQAEAQSYAQATAMGANRIPSSADTVITGTSSRFSWGDAGVGAAATLGVVLLLVGLGVTFARRRTRTLRHA